MNLNIKKRLRETETETETKFTLMTSYYFDYSLIIKLINDNNRDELSNILNHISNDLFCVTIDTINIEAKKQFIKDIYNVVSSRAYTLHKQKIQEYESMKYCRFMISYMLNRLYSEYRQQKIEKRGPVCIRDQYRKIKKLNHF